LASPNRQGATGGTTWRTTRLRLVWRPPYYHYRIMVLCRVQAALGKARFTLGKGFAEGRTRQRALGKEFVGKEFFAECHLSGTRQSLCRVPCQHSAKLTSTVICRFLCRVLTWQALGKEFLIFLKKIIFAECRSDRHSAQ